MKEAPETIDVIIGVIAGTILMIMLVLVGAPSWAAMGFGVIGSWVVAK